MPDTWKVQYWDNPSDVFWAVTKVDIIVCNVLSTPDERVSKIIWKSTPISEIGIAVELASTAACGTTRVGAFEDVEFEENVADCEIVTFGEAELKDVEFVETGIE